MLTDSKMQNLHIRHACYQPRRGYLSYGDVVGDSRWLRSLIATELLICVLVMASFVSSVESRAVRRDADTSLSPAPDSE
ncbi:Signal recognition particle GTPase [Pseudomonas syringae pv. actinidiae]|uniref:Signal recognition particle GTPase n=1 Tax=Pseudomonas syringae pv. actinidiae TaxID=103796 RepID=A0AAN4Q0C4_PSESF|nr:Signal recognition particle GTPase [Pseudomonas syringae pv. actinidiae]